MCVSLLHIGYECVAKLLISQAVVFFLLFAATFSHGAMPCVLKMLKLARNYHRIHSTTILGCSILVHSSECRKVY